MLTTILVIILILWLISAIPGTPFNSGIGPGYNGGIGLVLVILIILVLMGVISV